MVASVFIFYNIATISVLHLKLQALKCITMTMNIAEENKS